MHSLRSLALTALLAACAAEPRTALAHPDASPAREGPWSVELTDETGRALPTFEHRGRTFVLGEPGQRYFVRVRNGSAQRVEAVVSVDGRDVTDGRPSSFEQRGYLVEPWGEASIDGYRLDPSSVAAFRFGSVARSYAAATGDARDVGVIGVAVFPERVVARRQPLPPWYPRSSPYPNSYDDAESRSESAPSSAPPASAEAQPQGKASGGAPSARRERDASRPGLGTEFGEAHGSPVYELPFERASGHPAAVLTLRYDDRRGLLAAGVDLERWAWGRDDDRWQRERAQPFRSSGPYATPPPGWRGW
jgi:hypothetical protein